MVSKKNAAANRDARLVRESEVDFAAEVNRRATVLAEGIQRDFFSQELGLVTGKHAARDQVDRREYYVMVLAKNITPGKPGISCLQLGRVSPSFKAEIFRIVAKKLVGD